MEGHHVIIILTLLVCMVPVYAESSTKVNLIVGAIKSTKMFHSKRILLGPLNNDQSNIRESFKFLKAIQALDDGTTLIMGFKNMSKLLDTFEGLVVIPWEINNAQLCWLATNKLLMDDSSILALVKSVDDIRDKLETCPINIRCKLFPFYLSDNQQSITISEAYKLRKESDLVIRKLLTFSKAEGLILHSPHIPTWERRANLQGIEIKGITFEWYPWVIVTKNEASKEIMYGGVSMEILQNWQKSGILMCFCDKLKLLVVTNFMWLVHLHRLKGLEPVMPKIFILIEVFLAFAVGMSSSSFVSNVANSFGGIRNVELAFDYEDCHSNKLCDDLIQHLTSSLILYNFVDKPTLDNDGQKVIYVSKERFDDLFTKSVKPQEILSKNTIVLIVDMIMNSQSVETLLSGEIDLQSILRLDSKLFVLTHHQLYEAYKIVEVQINDVGICDGEYLNILSIWERRSDLQGIPLKVGLLGIDGFHLEVCNEVPFCPTDPLMLEGWPMVYNDLVAALRELTNFSIQWKLTNAHGTYRNGKWNGLVRLLAEGSVDFGLNLLSITGE